jgi:Lhr-like helicase
MRLLADEHPLGERTVNHYSFYAAFNAPEEYRLFTGGRPLGTMPADLTLYPGVLLIFAGRRWKVTAVDHAHKIIEAMPAPGGRPPLFNGGIAGVHDRVRAEMQFGARGRPSSALPIGHRYQPSQRSPSRLCPVPAR